MAMEHFDKLEKKALELVKRHKALKDDNDRLEAEAAVARKRAEELEAVVSSLQENRREILKRVNELIERLEAAGRKAHAEARKEENERQA